MRGKTPPLQAPSCILRDHPRGCGENMLQQLKSNPAAGSPPRMRGKLRYNIAKVIQIRITPADAGKTLLSRVNFRRFRDHPRGCGENGGCIQVVHDGLGSPPRMRGKPRRSARRLAMRRITPADAGKTGGHRPQNPDCRDHPRGCGENGLLTKLFRVVAGSPPRMRGKQYMQDPERLSHGITPADAGKTKVPVLTICLVSDHPRGCGENSVAKQKRAAAQGSPPRMRGKLRHSHSCSMFNGITPADAGKTLKRSFRNQPFCS